MRLKEVRVQKYRSIKDTGWFDIELHKTILVGPNEAGKTAVLQALQQLNPPSGSSNFDVLRDYPRSEYNDITTGKVNPASVTVVQARFVLESEDQKLIPEEFHECIYVFGRKLDNTSWHTLEGGPKSKIYKDLKKDLTRLSAHMDSNFSVDEALENPPPNPSETLNSITQEWDDNTKIEDNHAKQLLDWLTKNVQYVDEDSKEEERHTLLEAACKITDIHQKVLTILNKQLPVFILFSNYFRVHPLIHLEHLAHRIEKQILDDEQYDYGNQCLLKLLGFSARELSNLGKAQEPSIDDRAGLKQYRDQLDKRSYQLNAASVRLTKEIRNVWFPDSSRAEADQLRVDADGQYLKVVVEDDLGVEIELNQRSEGFQWLVSFFIVFFAEAADKHENAILLLDEPGLSLHGLKQRDFRITISRLAENNQTLYTTHSPFLVGPDELDMVRVVEMTDRSVGTHVHSNVTSSDPAALLPLQEALGYDLAQSLFSQQRNLILEGLTDYWYIEAVAELLKEKKIAILNDKIALIPAQSAGKVVYFATILYAHNLKVAALLDSDSAGEQAAQQEVLVHKLGNKAILRTLDVYSGTVSKPEIEDLLRTTLVTVAKKELGWDVTSDEKKYPSKPIVNIFEGAISNFSKYKLAKAFLRWSRSHSSDDLASDERDQWKELIDRINKALK